MENKELLKLLENNGVNQDYLEEMDGIESGSDEWIDILSEYIGKDIFKDIINDTLTDDDNNKINELINKLKNIGIHLV
jgi:hypothetical protein